MNRVIYNVGGYQPNHLSLGRLEEWDSDTSTYTRWNDDGDIAEQRALTDDEIATLTIPTASAPDIVALAERVAAMNEALDFLILDSLGGL